MAKGSYNISVSGDFDRGGCVTSDEGELESQECMNSCLNTGFLRSLSFHDRPRSSRAPINKEFRCTRYKALVSSSLEKIPTDLLLPSERKSKSSTYRCSESAGVNAEAEVATQSVVFNEFPSAASQQTDQNQISDWFENRYTRSGVESEKLLEKTLSILRAINKDVSESLTNLTRPESIALESVMEIYRNKVNKRSDCSMDSELDLSTEMFSGNVCENVELSVQQRSTDVQTHSTPQRPKDLQNEFFRQSPKTLQSTSSRESPKALQSASSRESPKVLQSAFSRGSPKTFKSVSFEQCPETLQSLPSGHSPKTLQSLPSGHSPKTLQSLPSGHSRKTLQSLPSGNIPKTLQSVSSRESPKKNLRAQCSQEGPKHLQTNAASYSPKHLPVHSAQQTLTNLQSQLSSDSGNTQSLTEPYSGNQRSDEESSRNVSTSPKRTAPDSATEVKSPFEFDLPSDHEQFVKIIGALQNRCLEYREMIQDIAISAFEECLYFSEISTNRIRHLRKQFESQKRNFKDFKELCCKSVVFGPDSLPIDNKVTEVIQSFYLKLLQEENETFMARLEFGLKMAEVYARILKYETESKKIITTLEKEILYLKKISIGFKV